MRMGPRNHAVRHVVAAGMSAALVQLFGTDARAQVAQPEPVRDMVGPNAEPSASGVGTRIGTFIFTPSLEIGEEFENNVFSTNTAVKSDFITLVRPAFDLISDWDTNALALHAEGDVLQYTKFPSENAGNVIVDGEGRLDILHNEYLLISAGYQSLDEPRSSPDSIEAIQLAGGALGRVPNQFSLETGDLRYVYAPGLIKLELDGGLVNYQFTNTPTTNGGLAINSDRSRTEYTVTPKVGYEFLDGYQVYVQASGNRREYDDTFDATPEHLQRSSSGYAAAVGVDFALTSLLTGTVYAGYAGQTYDDPRLSTLQGDYFGGALKWDASESTKVKLTLSRSIAETIVVGSSGFWDTQVSANIDQIVYHDLRLTGTATYTNSAYKGIVLNDDQFDVKAAIIWSINRYLDVDASAEWLHQTSDQALEGFDQEITQLGVKLHL
jgi:hypothetical protein